MVVPVATANSSTESCSLPSVSAAMKCSAALVNNSSSVTGISKGDTFDSGADSTIGSSAGGVGMGSGSGSGCGTTSGSGSGSETISGSSISTGSDGLLSS